MTTRTVLTVSYITSDAKIVAKIYFVLKTTRKSAKIVSERGLHARGRHEP